MDAGCLFERRSQETEQRNGNSEIDEEDNPLWFSGPG